jgi:hypothetical protein
MNNKPMSMAAMAVTYCKIKKGETIKPGCEIFMFGIWQQSRAIGLPVISGKYRHPCQKNVDLKNFT